MKLKTPDAKRADAAIELADALLAEFNNPSSALKGIGRSTMEKLLAYLKIVEKAQRRHSRRTAGAGTPAGEASATSAAADDDDGDAPAPAPADDDG